LFDLGNTLVKYHRPPEFPAILRRCLQRAAEAAGESLDDLAKQALFDRAAALNRESTKLAVWPLEDRLAKLFPAYSRMNDSQSDLVRRAFMVPIFDGAKLLPGAIDVLDRLRDSGVRTAIVSNTPWGSPSDLWREELDRFGLRSLVDADVFCVDVGWRKPHPAPFERTLELLGVSADKAIFVGDDPRWDVVGAQRVGLRPILFSPEPKNRQDCETIDRLELLLDLIKFDAQNG
jgi:putative hydrolase of the HAD superfamily